MFFFFGFGFPPLVECEIWNQIRQIWWHTKRSRTKTKPPSCTKSKEIGWCGCRGLEVSQHQRKKSTMSWWLNQVISKFKTNHRCSSYVYSSYQTLCLSDGELAKISKCDQCSNQMDHTSRGIWDQESLSITWMRIEIPNPTELITPVCETESFKWKKRESHPVQCFADFGIRNKVFKNRE